MSLLTEQQINDILDITYVCSTSIYATNLRLWNRKQISVQLASLDWDTAPKWADKATIMVRWDGIGQTDTVTLSKSKRPATPHPHAEIMAKYAEVAARRSDPWVEFEHCCDDIDEDYWIQCDAFIGFHSDYFYRHISYRHIGDKK